MSHLRRLLSLPICYLGLATLACVAPSAPPRRRDQAQRPVTPQGGSGVTSPSTANQATRFHLRVGPDSRPLRLTVDLPADPGRPTLVLDGRIESGIAWLTVDGAPVELSSGADYNRVALSPTRPGGGAQQPPTSGAPTPALQGSDRQPPVITLDRRDLYVERSDGLATIRGSLSETCREVICAGVEAEIRGHRFVAWCRFPHGTHQVMAVATDLAGNTSEPAALTVIRSFRAPRGIDKHCRTCGKRRAAGDTYCRRCGNDFLKK